MQTGASQLVFEWPERTVIVSSHSVTELIKVIHCVSLEVEVEFINIILILCFKQILIYDFYVHLHTRVRQC
jgi:hypothetical protein